MSNVDESRKLIEEMRQKRAALGEGGKLDVKKVYYKRLKRPTVSSVVMFCYTFGSGMLFSSAVITGYLSVWFCFIVFIGLLIYSYWKE